MDGLRNTEIPKTWVIALVIAAGVLLAPFAGWVVLAIWLSGFARGLHERMTRRLHGRVHPAAFLTVGLFTLLLVPVGAILTMLVMDAIALITKLAQSDQGHSMLVSLVSPKNGRGEEMGIRELLVSQG